MLIFVGIKDGLLRSDGKQQKNWVQPKALCPASAHGLPLNPAMPLPYLALPCSAVPLLCSALVCHCPTPVVSPSCPRPCPFLLCPTLPLPCSHHALPCPCPVLPRPTLHCPAMPCPASALPCPRPVPALPRPCPVPPLPWLYPLLSSHILPMTCTALLCPAPALPFPAMPCHSQHCPDLSLPCSCLIPCHSLTKILPNLNSDVARLEAFSGIAWPLLEVSRLPRNPGPSPNRRRTKLDEPRPSIHIQSQHKPGGIYF